MLPTLIACKATADSTPDETRTIQQTSSIEDALNVPPERRTLRDDMIIICYASTRVDPDLPHEARVSAIANTIANTIYTSEAVNILTRMSSLSPDERDALLAETHRKVGLDACPLRDVLNTPTPAADDVPPGLDPSLDAPSTGEPVQDTLSNDSET